MLLNILSKVKDCRRAQGRCYDLPNLLYISILAIISGADSYVKLANFFEIKFNLLKISFDLKWRNPPDESTIRKFIQGLDRASLEQSFRDYSNDLDKNSKYLAIDGKTLRGSFDNFNDKKSAHILSIFDINDHIILAHKEVDGSDKTNEIPKLQELIKEIGLTDKIFTIDAMHCQKKL